MQLRRSYPDGVVVVPSNLRGQLTQQAVLVALLKSQHPKNPNAKQISAKQFNTHLEKRQCKILT